MPRAIPFGRRFALALFIYLLRDVVDGAEPRVPSATRGVQGSGAAASLDAETDAKPPAVKIEKGFGGRVEQRIRAQTTPHAHNRTTRKIPGQA